jgi:hypothetical protein
MKKKSVVIVLGAVFLVIMLVDLLAFSFLSKAHPTAKTAILRSQEVAASVGSARLVVLIGTRQKLIPSSLSCTSSTYIVIGESGVVIVTVKLSMQGWQPDWTVDVLSLGWFGDSQSSAC